MLGGLKRCASSRLAKSASLSFRVRQPSITRSFVRLEAAHSNKRGWGAPAGAMVTLFCGAVAIELAGSPAQSEAEQLKLYTLQELRAMCDDEGRIVVAYRGDLFDMSDFSGHPGGVGRLQMAAGNDLEVYWAVYTQHNRGHIDDVMQPYKIGRVSPPDMATITENTHYTNYAYQNNPEQLAGYKDELLVNTRYPYNAEGRLEILRDEWQTPVGRHFVRNHSSVPDIDPDDYLLTVTGEGVTETTFTLEDLKKFPKVEITTVIQCNGNRREDMHYIDGKTPAFGPPHWVAGAIGNAKWSGVRMRDLLRAAGMDVDAISLGAKQAPEKATNIGLLGYDHDEIGNQYCCSFPFDKAVDPFGDVLVAYEMNDQPIPRGHGYPVRAIVPGHAGARNCKFLEMVTVTDNPCSGHSNWHQYSVHAPDVPMRKIAEFYVHQEEIMQDPAVQEMPVQSMITSPTPNEVLSAIQNGNKVVKVKGIAWGGGGSGLNRVDVSLDNGEHFTKADLIQKPIKERRRAEWSWQFFEKEIEIPESMRTSLERGVPQELVLTSKAVNTAWNVQPENIVYNAHGCCVNHWYRVPVTLCPITPVNVKAPDGDFANKPTGGKFATPFRNLDHPTALEIRQLKRELEFTKGERRDNACTCGCDCKPDEGCLKPRYMNCPQRRFERTRQQGPLLVPPYKKSKAKKEEPEGTQR